MKTIPQNVLILIGCIVVALVILSVFGSYSTKAPLQRQAIHIFDAPSLKISDPNGRLKISEIKPNSMISFYYPDPDRFKNRDPFEQFILIRLPDYLGGTVNDASAFRAYSALDPASHCLVKYWSQEERRRIEDPCGGSVYEPVSGHATIISGHSVLVSKNLALPYLTISSDENGYLYAEPPVWTEDKNGVVGIGRTISEKEIESANQLIVSREKHFREAMEGFAVPDHFSTGHKLDHIGGDGIRTNLAEYFSQDSSIMLFYGYCNCTKSKEILADEEMTRVNSQILDVDGVPVVAYPNAVIDYVNQIYDKYVFLFYYDGYRIALHTNQKLDAGLVLVRELLDFENNTHIH
jgi:ubiquinol-cytochrome c reductase iron-sulfur subunit